MSSSNFGILNSFDHNTQTWKTYKGRIRQFFIANDIDAKSDAGGKKRKAILLSALTEDTYKLATDLVLPKDVEKVSYEDLITILDTHFTPKQAGFADRHNFYSAVQMPGETYSQWAARLRGLTAKCDFLNVEEALRDRFIMGMQPGREKEKLYALDLSSESTLAKLVETAENLSRARAAVAAAAAAPAQSAPAEDHLFRIARDKEMSSVGKVKCSVCGYMNHKSSECKYANYVCRKCHVKGHLRKMCRKINYVELDCSDKGDEQDDGKCFYIRSIRGQPMVETVYINKKPFKFEIDSGSTVTVISERFYKNNFKDMPLSPTQKRLMTYSGDRIMCLGTCSLQLTYAARTHTIVFYVVRDGGPPLLGRDFISLFNLQLVPVNYFADPELAVNKIEERYPKVFSNELGAFNKYKIKLLLKENVKPIFIKARPVAFALREKVDKEIDRLLGLGILEPVEYSDYASPIVPVLKRNGTVRLCADYSGTINKQLLVEQYPLPTTTELFSKLHGGQQFSKIDLSMAYNQFLLDDDSKKLTTISTNRGLFNYSRLVFGLASAPSIFQRAIENVLCGIGPGVICMLDDILITGKDRNEHLQRLQAVLQRLQDAGLTLQKEKCSFFQNEITYLGFIITKHGLNKSPDKVKAMVEAPAPKNVNELQSFLGLINYYRNFIQNASSILSPLYELLKKGCKWSWGEVHNAAFQEIKTRMTSEQTLAHFNPNAKLILTVDASPSGMGAILSQIDSDGKEQPISFVSRTLNTAEKRYAQIQKEATAIIYGVRRFHQYLYGRGEPFILRTDHKPLLSIFGPHKGIPEMSANRLQRYALFLSSYNYKIEYVNSANNSADYLSRSSLPRESHECACTEQCRCCDCEVAYDRATYVCFVVDDSMPVTLDKLREETQRDEVLRRVIDYITNGWPPKLSDTQLKPYHLCRLQLSYENGCVMRGHKVVIPSSLREILLKELHSSHLGIVKTKAEARSRFWFPGIDQAVETMIGSCKVCIQLRPSPPRAPPAPWSHPSSPFDRLHIDFLGPIKGSMYLVVVDAHTKWVEVYNMKMTTTSTAVIGNLCDFMSRYGVPKTIVSDNGTSFCSREFKAFCTANAISQVTSPVYHPPSNGQAESFVKIVKRGIKSSLLSAYTAKETSIKLLRYLMDYRNSVHTTTGLSPAQLVFGHKLRSRLDLLDPTSPPLSTSPTQVCNPSQCTPCKVRKIKQFKKDDVVIYKKFINKTNFNWHLGIVLKKIGRVLYLIKDKESSEIHKRHINQLMLYKGDRREIQAQPSPPPLPRTPSPPPSPAPPPVTRASTSPPARSLQPLPGPRSSPSVPSPPGSPPGRSLQMSPERQSPPTTGTPCPPPQARPAQPSPAPSSTPVRFRSPLLSDTMTSTTETIDSSGTIDDEFYEAEATTDTESIPGEQPTRRVQAPRKGRNTSFKKYFSNK